MPPQRALKIVSPGPAHWVEWGNGWLSHGRVDESGETYRQGNVFHRWRLPGACS